MKSNASEISNDQKKMRRHCFLTGYRGSGKSVVGRLVAEILGREFVDTDDQIERRTGRSIREIFESDGEETFRGFETEEITRLADASSQIISLGGGAVLRAENRQWISRLGNCVWLTGTVANLHKRIYQDSSSEERRPALTDLDGYAEIESVLAIRTPLYREVATKIISTDSLRPDAIAREIAEWLVGDGDQ
jgi:shikimate kinase